MDMMVKHIMEVSVACRNTGEKCGEEYMTAPEFKDSVSLKIQRTGCLCQMYLNIGLREVAMHQMYRIVAIWTREDG